MVQLPSGLPQSLGRVVCLPSRLLSGTSLWEVTRRHTRSVAKIISGSCLFQTRGWSCLSKENRIRRREKSKEGKKSCIWFFSKVSAEKSWELCEGVGELSRAPLVSAQLLKRAQQVECFRGYGGGRVRGEAHRGAEIIFPSLLISSLRGVKVLPFQGCLDGTKRKCSPPLLQDETPSSAA